MIDKDMIFLQSPTIIKKELHGPFGETYPVFCDSDQAMSVKAEEGSDAEEEEGGDPMPMTFLEIKAEPEVS
jgi:hypothetical protein